MRASPATLIQGVGRSIFNKFWKHQPPVAAPLARRQPVKTWSAHGEQGLDEYKWLEDPHDPAVTEYLQAENQYAEQVLTTPPMSSLQRELRADVNGIDISMPDDTLIAERSGEYEYFTRASPYAHHHLPLYCRRPVHQSGSSLSFDNLDLGAGTQQLYTHKSRDCHPSASELGSGRSSSSWDQEGGLNSEEVILDPNTIPSASGYVEIGQLKVSPDGRLLAFTVDTIGDEAYTIHVKNLLTGEMYPQHVIADTVSVQWSADSCVLFYTHINELGRPYQVRRRVLREGRGRRDDSGIDPAEQKDGSERGTHNGELNCSEEGVSSSQRNTLSGAVHTLTGAIKDELILQEDDPSFLMDVNLTKDQRYFLLSMTSKSATETYLIDSALPYSTPQLVCSRRQHLDYCVEHAGGRLILVTNADDSPNYKLLSRDVASYLPAPTVATHVSSSTPKSTDLGERGDQQLQQQRQQHQQQQRRQPSHADGPALDLSEWETVVDHDQNTNIEDLDVFKHYMVLYERHNGSPQLRVICNESHAYHYVPLPHAVGKIMPGANQDFETDTVRFIFSSPIVPDLTYDYNMATRELLLLSEYSVSGVDLDRYQCSQILIPASSPPSSPGLHTALRSADETNDQERPQESGASDEDEEVIPVTLVHLRGLFDQHQSADIISAPTASPVSSPSPSSSQSSVVSKAPPLLMHVYGAYGINADLGFSASYLSLLNRGWVFAIAHVRGGGERGKRWYDQGKQLQKGNTFNDVITCAEGLIDRGFTQAGRLSIQGYSAGGLAAAAAIQKKPSLFTAAVLRVPFLDVLGSMMDEDLPLTKHERDEWGDPIADKDVFDLIKSYCPYRNINSTVPSAASPASSGFPSVLVTASFQDPRVSYSVPAKWVARMRRKVSCTHPYTHTRDMEHQSTAPMDGRDSDGGGDSASPSSSSLMLVTSFEGGHFGDNSSMNSYDEDTRDFAFFIHHDNEKAKQNP